jgi:hypothetical protein
MCTRCKLDFLVCLVMLFNSCIEKNTTDPIKAFTYWMPKVPEGVKVINGTYWESPHWTKEYILYLEMQASEKWLKQFHIDDRLTQDESIFSVPEDAPTWFRPPANYKDWRSGVQGPFEFFEDRKTGHLFVFAMQL